MKARQEAVERRRLEVQKAKRQKSEARGGNLIYEKQTPFLSQERQMSKSLEQQLRQEKAHLQEVEERSEQRKKQGNNSSNFRHALHQALLERLTSAAHLRTERLAAKTQRSRLVAMI